MSTRLQVVMVVMDEADVGEYRRLAARDGLTLSEWVRQTLRHAGRHKSSGSVDRKLAAIQPAFEAPLSTVDDVLPVTVETLKRARDVVLGSATLSARDAIHVAVMQQHGMEEIFSFDRGFDEAPGIRRLTI